MKQDVKSSGELSFLSLMDDYNRYKNFFEDYVDFPTEIKGKKQEMFKVLKLFLDFQLQTNLSFVRIFLDTPTFDRVTKDDAAKGSNRDNLLNFHPVHSI